MHYGNSAPLVPLAQVILDTFPAGRRLESGTELPRKALDNPMCDTLRDAMSGRRGCGPRRGLGCAVRSIGRTLACQHLAQALVGR